MVATTLPVVRSPLNDTPKSIVPLLHSPVKVQTSIEAVVQVEVGVVILLEQVNHVQLVVVVRVVIMGDVDFIMAPDDEQVGKVASYHKQVSVLLGTVLNVIVLLVVVVANASLLKDVKGEVCS